MWKLDWGSMIKKGVNSANTPFLVVFNVSNSLWHLIGLFPAISYTCFSRGQSVIFCVSHESLATHKLIKHEPF